MINIVEDRLSNRNVTLDAIRGLSALLVFAYHLNGYTNNQTTGFTVPLSSQLNIGVEVFFILSGVSLTLFATRQCVPGNYPNYYISRFTRVLPAYYASILLWFTIPYVKLLALTCGIPIIPPKLPTFAAILHDWNLWSHILLVHNYSINTIQGISGVYWTLGVEIQYYIVFPFLLSLLKRFSIRQSVVLVSVLILLNSLISVFTSNEAHTLWTGNLPYNLPYFLSGMIVGLNHSKLNTVIDRNALLFTLSAIFGLILACVSINVHSVFVFARFTLGLSLFCVLYTCLKKVLFARGLAIFGSISFSFYLLHMNISDNVTQTVFRFGKNDKTVFVSIVLSLLLSTLIATVFKITFESPALRQRLTLILNSIWTR